MNKLIFNFAFVSAMFFSAEIFAQNKKDVLASEITDTTITVDLTGGLNKARIKAPSSSTWSSYVTSAPYKFENLSPDTRYEVEATDGTNTVIRNLNTRYPLHLNKEDVCFKERPVTLSLASPEFGGGHGMMVNHRGEIFVWGKNDIGQISLDGTTNTTPIKSPTLIMGNAPWGTQKIRQVKVMDKFIVGSTPLGSKGSIALTDGGEIYFWGETDIMYNAFGTNINSSFNVPTRILLDYHGDTIPKIERMNILSSGVGSLITDDGKVYINWANNMLENYNGVNKNRRFRGIIEAESGYKIIEAYPLSSSYDSRGAIPLIKRGINSIYLTSKGELRTPDKLIAQDMTGLNVNDVYYQDSRTNSTSPVATSTSNTGQIYSFRLNGYSDRNFISGTYNPQVLVPQQISSVNVIKEGKIIKTELTKYNGYALDSTGNLFGWGVNNKGQLLGLKESNDGTGRIEPAIIAKDIKDFWVADYGLVVLTKNLRIKVAGWNVKTTLGVDLGSDLELPAFLDISQEMYDIPANKLTVESYMIDSYGNINPTPVVDITPLKNGLMKDVRFSKYKFILQITSLAGGVLQEDEIYENSKIKHPLRFDIEQGTVLTANLIAYCDDFGNSEGFVVSSINFVKRGEVLCFDEKISQISASQDNVMVLKGNGKVFITGGNSDGQLGIGKPTSEVAMRPVEIKLRGVQLLGGEKDKIIKIFSGSASRYGGFHSMAVQAMDGRIYVAGNNTNKSLGFTAATTLKIRELTLSKGISTVDFILASSSSSTKSAIKNTMIVTDGGKVIAFGTDSYGSFGLGRNASEQNYAPGNNMDAKGVNDAVRLVSDGISTLIITSEGKLKASGYNGYGQLGIGNATSSKLFLDVNLSEKVLDVAFSDRAFHAITTKGNLYSWGYNIDGKLGLGDERSKYVPVILKTGSTDFQKISGGNKFFGALDKEGNLWTTGSNSHKQLGDNLDIDKRNLLMKVQFIKDIDDFDLGRNFVIVRKGKTLYGWGQNGKGQLGIGNTITPIVTPTPMNKDYQAYNKLEIYKRILASARNSTGDDNSNSLAFKIHKDFRDDIINPDAGNVRGSGNNIYIVLNEYAENSTNVVKEIEKIKLTGSNLNDTIRFTGLDSFTPYKMNIRIVCSKGDSTDIQHKIIWTHKEFNQEECLDAGIKQITDNINYVLLNNGDVYEWGDSDPTTSANSALKPSPQKSTLLSQKGIIQLGITGGINNLGTTNLNRTKKVSLLYLSNIGEIYSYGDGEYGALGHGNKSNQSTPKKIKGFNTPIISMGRNNYIFSSNPGRIVIDENGKIWGWGRNYKGELGLGDKTEKYTPTQISNISDVIDVVKGYQNSLVLKNDGTVYIAGGGSYALGLGVSTADKLIHTKLNLIDIKSIEMGYKTGFAINNKGEVFSWGDGTGDINIFDANNEAGSRLGYAAPRQLVPRKVEALSSKKIKSVRTRGVTYFLAEDGDLYGSGSSIYASISSHIGTTYQYPQNSDYLGHSIGYNEPVLIDKNIKRVGFLGLYGQYKEKKDGSLYTWGVDYANFLGNGGRGSVQSNSSPKRIGKEWSNWLPAGKDFEDVLTYVSSDVDKIKVKIDILSDNVKSNRGTKKNMILVAQQVSDTSKTSKKYITTETEWEFTGLLPSESYNIWLEVDCDNEDNILLSEREVYHTKEEKLNPSCFPNKIIDIQAAVSNNFYVVREDGKLWAWGNNRYGELGVGDYDSHSEPKQVLSEDENGNQVPITNISKIIPYSYSYGVENGNIRSIDKYSNAVLFLDREGDLWFSGKRVKGMLSSGMISTPIDKANNVLKKVKGIDNVKDVVTPSKTSVVVLKRDGTVWGWGENYDYQLSGTSRFTKYTNDLNIKEIKNLPKNIIKIVDNYNGVTFLDGEGDVYKWGRVFNGKIMPGGGDI